MTSSLTLPDSGLSTNSVHVWLLDLLSVQPGSDPEDVSLLDEREIQRAHKFRRSTDRHAYVAAHSATRRILGRYLDLPPGALTFELDALGKPRLASTTPERRRSRRDLRFSLSHSDSHAMLAVSDAAEVGADIERLTRMRDCLEIATRTFAPAETRLLRQARREHERESLFFRIWTRKEAYVKGIGAGLSESLSSFTVLPLEETPIQVRQMLPSAPLEGRHDWQVFDVDAPRGFAAAVAVQLPQAELQVWQFEHTDAGAWWRA